MSAELSQVAAPGAPARSWKPYPAYKDSGVEWLGKVPEHWEVKRLKYIAEIILGKMLTNDDKGGFFLKPYLRAQNINWQNVNTGDIKQMWFSKKELNQYRLKLHDLLISEGGEVGRTAVWKNEIEECYIQNSVHKVTMLNGNNPFYFLSLFFLYGQIGFFNSIVSQVSIAHLTKEKLKDVFCLIPSIKEQFQISDYIKYKTTRIDSLIEKKQKLIELLKEERAAVINEAVTKGLDPGAPMRDSGVGWLGKVSEGWEVKRLKYVATLKSGEFINAENINPVGDFPVFGGNGLRGYTNTYTHEGNYILIGRQGALCGNINLVAGKFYATEHAVVVTILDTSETVWLAELLRAMNLNQYSQASAQPGLAVETIKNLFIPIPPYKDQKKIVLLINSENERINSTISKIENEVSLLQEYRTALISEVVTGKIDVRGECETEHGARG